MGGVGEEVALLSFCFTALACEVLQLWPPYLITPPPPHDRASTVHLKSSSDSVLTLPAPPPPRLGAWDWHAPSMASCLCGVCETGAQQLCFPQVLFPTGQV